MKKIINISGVILLSLFSTLSFSNVGKEAQFYEKIALKNENNNGEISVNYFFNSNCNSCKKFSPVFDKWKQDREHLARFTDTSFAPFKDWEWASRGFAATQVIDGSMTRADFQYAQEESDVGLVTDILRAADVISIATHEGRGNIMSNLSSLEVTNAVKDMQKAGHRYGVTGVPAIVITVGDSAYRISPEFQLSYQGMLKISDALIAYHVAKKKHDNIEQSNDQK